MKSPYILTNNKLTDEEFKSKYYVAETGQQQFHTMDLSDGENERMQLLINNDRANRDYIKWVIDLMREMSESSYSDRTKIRKKLKVVSFMAIAALVFGVTNIIVASLTAIAFKRRLRNQMATQSPIGH